MFDLLRYSNDLFDQLHRELEQFSGLPTSIRAVGRGMFPAINVGHTSNAIEVYAFIPGVDPAKLEVSVDRGLLTIAGLRTSNLQQDEQHSVYARERFAGSFKRVVSLPEGTNVDKVNANYKNGILRITIAKHEASQPRQIEVK